MKLKDVVPKTGWKVEDKGTHFIFTHPQMPAPWYITLDKITLSGEIRAQLGSNWKQNDLFQWVIETKLLPKLYHLIVVTDQNNKLSDLQQQMKNDLDRKYQNTFYQQAYNNPYYQQASYYQQAQQQASQNYGSGSGYQEYITKEMLRKLGLF